MGLFEKKITVVTRMRTEVSPLETIIHLGVSKNMGKPPNHQLKNRVFHYFHHPFWGVKSPYFWFNTLMVVFQPIAIWDFGLHHGIPVVQALKDDESRGPVVVWCNPNAAYYEPWKSISCQRAVEI